MNKQEIFNQVYLGLKSQDFQQSLRGGNLAGCAYRSWDGMKCAVGHLIADEEYFIRMEGKSIEGLFNNDFLPTRLHEQQNFLRELQSIHDNSRDTEVMKRKLLENALDHDLKVPE